MDSRVTQQTLIKKTVYRFTSQGQVLVRVALDEALAEDQRAYGGCVFGRSRTPRSSARRALYAYLAYDSVIVRDAKGVLRFRVDVVTVVHAETPSAAIDLLAKCRRGYSTVLADPPWRFENRTGKVSPEHRRLARYATMSDDEIKQLPVGELVGPKSHLYLWVPNALLQTGLDVMRAWGFQYKAKVDWVKIRKDGGVDGSGVGFYFRNATEVLLFGIKGKLRTLAPGRRQTNVIMAPKRGHSIKPDEQYDIIESCSPGPFLELFARRGRQGWDQWGDQAPQLLVTA